jgi:hypothetical protein
MTTADNFDPAVTITLKLYALGAGQTYLATEAESAYDLTKEELAALLDVAAHQLRHPEAHTSEIMWDQTSG